ncbi:MAG: type II toxin-antitoxin system PemK/MazF family toxin [Clostridia bacterium]|nr:type II toxin-antitoxin system PemK/MazF family toxin [Clostridia bacterium]
MKHIKRGEIYYTNLDSTIGSEQSGNRPVLIIQNDTGNLHSNTTIVAAITSKEKKAMISHINIDNCGLNGPSLVLLEQIRTIDKSRLGGYIGKLSSSEMNQVDIAIVKSFGIGYLEDLIDGQKTSGNK